MYGGINPFFNLDNTWTWNGIDWSQKSPTTTPRAFICMAMAYDQRRSRTVLFRGNPWAPRNETWEWDGNDWLHVATTASPEYRPDYAMTYDMRNRQLVLLAGHLIRAGTEVRFRETWVYGQAGSYAAYGAGCAGSLGTPTLAASGNSAPVLGAPFTVDLA